MNKKICNQVDCDKVATHFYIWPGQGEKFSCEPHAKWAQQIIGHTFAGEMQVHEIPIEEEEP